jgi:hypothetical protein
MSLLSRLTDPPCQTGFPVQRLNVKLYDSVAWHEKKLSYTFSISLEWA